MRITAISVDNFRVIKHAEVMKIPQILGIWGRNGSGKSALIQAVVALSNAVKFSAVAGNPPPQFNQNGLQMGGFEKILWKGGLEEPKGEIDLMFKDPDGSASFGFGQNAWKLPAAQGFDAKLVRYFPPRRSLVGRQNMIQQTPSGDLGPNPEMLHPFVHYYLHERMRDRITTDKPNEVDEIDSWLTRFGLGNLSDRTSGQSVTAAFMDSATSFDTDFTDGGFGGVSIAPVVIEAHSFRNGVLLVEEPELSLHPAAQAELFDFFLDMVKKRGHQVIFTSHSTYLLGRLARYARDAGSDTTELLGVLTCRKDANGAHYTPESMTNLIERMEKIQPLLSELYLRWPA
jgi:ABC-type dipeptide/oligopeptide/nickel transport system ATPase component